MKRFNFLAVIFILAVATVCFAENSKGLLIDDLQCKISGGADGTVDFGSGNGSTVEVTAATDIVHSGKQSLKIAYDAVSGGYIWIARGFGLDVSRATWSIKPEKISWSKYNAFRFYMYGSGSKAKIAFDVKDNGGELWRFLIEDNFTGWKEIVCPFADFFPRGDWQPAKADKNGNMDFPIRNYQFEPLPVSKGVVYIDSIELIKK
jgi:hypothetical protein